MCLLPWQLLISDTYGDYMEQVGVQVFNLVSKNQLYYPVHSYVNMQLLHKNLLIKFSLKVDTTIQTSTEQSHKVT